MRAGVYVWMNAHPEDQRALRRYLLGESATPEEARRVEERLLADDLFAEEFGAAEDELVDDYAAGTLPAGEREKFERHFLSTDERRRKLTFARALHGYVGGRASQTARPAKFAPYWKGAAAAVVLLGLGLGVWLLLLRESELDRGLRLLAEAPRPTRLTEARVSGLPHAPLLVTRDAGAAEPDAARRRAELSLREALEASPGPAPRHALGRLHLDQGRVDDALKQLEAALAEDPSNARLRADLGAAYLERGRRAGGESPAGPEDFARALEHLNRALALDASLPEALFNRALTYEELKLPRQAEADWRAYLEHDPSSPWAEEARARLRRLEDLQQRTSVGREQLYEIFLAAHQSGDTERAWEAVAQGSYRAGDYVFERLLDDYLAAEAQGRGDEAAERLALLSSVGEMKARRAGDLYAAQVVNAYRAATPQRRAALRRARSLAAAGQEQLVANDYGAALESFAQAQRTFADAGDAAEARQAEYWAAICLQQLREHERAAAVMERLARECREAGQGWLAVRALNGLTAWQFRQSEYSKALATAAESAALGAQSLDTYGRQTAVSNLAETYRNLGNLGRALFHAREALDLVALGRAEPKQAWLVYSVAAALFNTLGRHDVALAYQEVGLRMVVSTGDPAAECVTYANLGLLYARARGYGEGIGLARRALDSALARGPRVGPQATAYAALQLANLYRQAGETDKALETFGLAAELSARLASPTFLYHAHKGRLLTHLSAGGFAAARQDLDAALKLFEQSRRMILEESNRQQFFDAEHGVYDLAINFEHAVAGDAARAFEYSESSRARTLLDHARAGATGGAAARPGPESARPLSLAEIRGRLPEQARVLQYAALEDKLLVWVVSKHGFHAAERKVSLRELEQAVGQYLSAVSAPQTDTAEVSRLSRETYALLLGPVEQSLTGTGQLYVVPDKILHQVPFGALVNPATGRHLLEDRVVASVPSASVLVACLENVRGRGESSGEGLLSIGDPDFDRGEFPSLPALPSAAREAAEVASLYRGPSLLTRQSATEAEVVRRMPSAEVVHLAAHSLPDDVSLSGSRLLLARHAPAGDDGSLRAAEIQRLRLPRTRLVVLSACQTAAGRTLRGEGVMSLARPFLAAGVPSVVASLWPVDSEATAELMVAFHRYRRRETLPSAEALRRAQLDMLRSPREAHRHPFYWASFQLIGAAES